jgi:Putative Actinobacterial Holin-X, holin superfamily III
MADVPRGNETRDRPIGELLKQLSEETSALVRQEMELAKAEMSQKGKEAGAGAGLLGAGGVAGLLALGALTACMIAALDLVMATWLAALIAAVVWAAIAGVLALTGRERLTHATPPVPEETVDTVKEDVEWAKTRARSAGR